MDWKTRKWSLLRKSTARFCLFVCIFTLLFCTSCSNKSLFTGWDYPDTEKIARYSGEKLLSSLEATMESPAFYRVLTVAQREKILSTLDTMMSQEKEVLVPLPYPALQRLQ